MDDFSNTPLGNNDEGSVPPVPPVTPDNGESEPVNQVNEPSPYNTAPSGSADSPQYGTSPAGYSTQGSTQPGGYNTQNSGYGTSPSFGTTQSPYGQPGYTPTPLRKPGSGKQQNQTGKIIFAVLICVCIAISSIAIGFAVSSNNNNGTQGSNPTVTNAQQDNTNEATTGEGAAPNVENSPNSASSYSGSGTMTPEQIYASVKSINVGVIVYSQNEKSGEGSGIIVGTDSTGKYTYILTAAHVISGKGISAQIRFSGDSEEEIDAEIVGFDTKTDVGVLKVAKTGFTAAKFGDSDKLTVGQKVYAIGNPGGTEFFGSFTDGMISALDRPVATSTSSSYDLQCIQHSAAINPGNSGGALVNEYGQVIGLNSSKIADTDYEDMGFAVPINTVLEVYNEIVKNGYVTNRPMLGITYYAVSSDYTYSAIAWKNDMPYGSVVIASITKNSDLNNNGVQTGDIITAVNGKKLESTSTLLEVIEKSKVGDSITITVCRLNNDGSINKTFDAKVKLIEDKGNTVSENSNQQEQTTDPFSSFFFGR